MRTNARELAFWIAVRRTGRGSKPFRWEIRGADTMEPLHLSEDSFSNMEAAYHAGTAGLQDFLQTTRRSAA
ncbi:MAG: hypothetical protein AB7S57_03060 [Acetobacteraceae bacterium]